MAFRTRASSAIMISRLQRLGKLTPSSLVLEQLWLCCSSAQSCPTLTTLRAIPRIFQHALWSCCCKRPLLVQAGSSTSSNASSPRILECRETRPGGSVSLTPPPLLIPLGICILQSKTLDLV